MNLEWHYPREDKNDLPKRGRTVIIAEHVPSWESRDGLSYGLVIDRMYVEKDIDPDHLGWQVKYRHVYAWAYIEMPPLKKGE